MPKDYLPSVVNTEFLKRLKSLAYLSMSERDIFYYCDMTSTRWCELKKAHPEIERAIHEGRAIAKAEISKSLMDSAKSGDVRAQIFFLQAQARWEAPSKTAVRENAAVQELPIPPKLNTVDPIEASKIYQRVMLGENFSVPGKFNDTDIAEGEIIEG